MEETLIILKPDCMEKRIAGEVITRFENAGFDIVASKVTQLDGPILRVHYAHVADLPFFPEIEAFMSSRPVMPMILRGENVIAQVRELSFLVNEILKIARSVAAHIAHAHHVRLPRQ